MLELVCVAIFDKLFREKLISCLGELLQEVVRLFLRGNMHVRTTAIPTALPEDSLHIVRSKKLLLCCCY